MSVPAASPKAIFTIGHSTLELKPFAALLKIHGVGAVADVRSVPYSRWQPQFNREQLRVALRAGGIDYAFLGRELGARPDDPNCYTNGRVQFRTLAKTALFRTGIQRIVNGSQRMSVALMCAERDPLDCHRMILVGRELATLGLEVQHILDDGTVEDQKAAVERLCDRLGFPQGDLFERPGELAERAYAERESQIAYVAGDRSGETQEAHQCES